MLRFAEADTQSGGPDVILARHGDSELTLRRSVMFPEGDVHTVILHRQGTGERLLARYAIPWDLAQGTQGLGCTALPLKAAPRQGIVSLEDRAKEVETMLASGEWSSAAVITIHIPVMEGAFWQRVDSVDGLSIIYDVGCGANLPVRPVPTAPPDRRDAPPHPARATPG